MCSRMDLNHGPLECESNALPTELREQLFNYSILPLNAKMLT